MLFRSPSEVVQAEVEPKQMHLWGEIWKIAKLRRKRQRHSSGPCQSESHTEMPTPKTEKEVRGFLGRLNYIARFISHLTATCEPIFKLLKKDQVVRWNDEC